METSRNDRQPGGPPTDFIVPPILRAAVLMERLSDRHIFEPAGISLTAFRILAFLATSGPAPSSNMLEDLGGTKSNLSQRLGMLERKGYVARTTASASVDRRIIPFRITATGRRKLRETERLARDAGLRLSEHFSKRELDAHQAFIRKLIGLLERTGSDKCPGCDTKNLEKK